MRWGWKYTLSGGVFATPLLNTQNHCEKPKKIFFFSDRSYRNGKSHEIIWRPICGFSGTCDSDMKMPSSPETKDSQITVVTPTAMPMLKDIQYKPLKHRICLHILALFKASSILVLVLESILSICLYFHNLNSNNL